MNKGLLAVCLVALVLGVVCMAPNPAQAQGGAQVDLIQLQFDLYSLPAINEFNFTKEQLTQLIPLIKRGMEEQQTIAAKQAPVDAESLTQLLVIRDQMATGKANRDSLRAEPASKAMRNLESALTLAHQDLPATKEILAVLNADQRDKLQRLTLMPSRLSYSPPPPPPPSGGEGVTDDMTKALTVLDRVRRMAQPEYQANRVGFAERMVERTTPRNTAEFGDRVKQTLAVFDQIREMPQGDFEANKRTIAQQAIVPYVHEDRPGGAATPPPPPTMSSTARPQIRSLLDSKVVRLLEFKLKSM